MVSNTVKAIAFLSLIFYIFCLEYTNATHFSFGEEEIEAVPTTLPGELKFAHVVSEKELSSALFFLPYGSMNFFFFLFLDFSSWWSNTSGPVSDWPVE